MVELPVVVEQVPLVNLEQYPPQEVLVVVMDCL
jgi:hypothetical protein